MEYRQNLKLNNNIYEYLQEKIEKFKFFLVKIGCDQEKLAEKEELIKSFSLLSKMKKEQIRFYKQMTLMYFGIKEISDEDSLKFDQYIEMFIELAQQLE